MSAGNFKPQSHWPALAFALIALVLGSSAAMAEEPDSEITQLLDALSVSQCEFFRNGSWYGAERARAHLERKLAYVRRSQPDISAEQFIAVAASESSRSGEPYRVRCGATEQQSAQWFLERLEKIRATASIEE